ncbi:conserved hypothetical protein [Massilia sp. 9I]|nr:BrnA antitoxin family protein [Massilia sp. 9I]VXC71159.1 conserved hypothetical protein [Massilia sp. 9I]
MPKLKPGTEVPTLEEDSTITRAAMEDPDARPYTDEEWTAVKPKRSRGRPKTDAPKQPISIRVDSRVLDAFKATGDGWQTRMNDALVEWAGQHGMLAEGAES